VEASLVNGATTPQRPQSQHSNRDYEQIAREILAEAAETDRLEDELYGEKRGDELPPQLATGEGRRAWLRDARRRLDEKRASEPKPVPRSRPPDPYQLPQTPTGKVNVTDPDSKNVKTPRGYMQGYNAQAVANEQQIVIAAEVNVDSSDFGHLEGMVTTAQTELERVGVSDTVEVVVADAGYWHQKQMEGVINRGIQVLIPPDAGKRRGTRPGWNGGAYAHMRRVLETELGGGLYRKRKAMIEPVFANTKFNRRIDRFLRRGRSAVRSEWRLITATHNLLKLHKHQVAVAGA